ncbi:MAG: NUDIX domain-containing protein [Myxococcota bacterium]
MAKVSAGLLMCRHRGGQLEFLLVHPGGPFFARRDDGAWTIPKGAIDDGETALDAARREFAEETGLPAPADGLVELGEIRQKGGKRVSAWAFVGDCDPSLVKSTTFEMEWPRGSGRMQRFPEVDRAGFFGPDAARVKLLEAQIPFLDRAAAALG